MEMKRPENGCVSRNANCWKMTEVGKTRHSFDSLLKNDYHKSIKIQLIDIGWHLLIGMMMFIFTGNATIH